jgi:CheY-like chemotaxis protein
MGRILVVEDSSAIRLLIRRRLEMAGHQVEEAANGLEALDQLGSTAEPDLIVLDESMPVFDGAGLLTRLREQWSELPVIVVSASPASESDPIMHSADARLAKPINFERLFEVIDRLTSESP